MGENAVFRSKLKEGDVFVQASRPLGLRLELGDLRIREKSNEVDVMNAQIRDDTDVGEARRERAYPSDRDRDQLLVRNRGFDGLHGGIEPFDVADHQRELLGI